MTKLMNKWPREGNCPRERKRERERERERERDVAKEQPVGKMINIRTIADTATFIKSFYAYGLADRYIDDLDTQETKHKWRVKQRMEINTGT